MGGSGGSTTRSTPNTSELSRISVTRGRRSPTWPVEIRGCKQVSDADSSGIVWNTNTTSWTVETGSPHHGSVPDA